LSDDAKDFIAEKGFDKEFGARPLKRSIQKYVEDTLAEEIIKSKLQEGDTILLAVNESKDGLNVNIKKKKQPKAPKE
jgi:ATP-dependent Clp protease ATP-binding subunit ClpC